jgi:hypothetical protein
VRLRQHLLVRQQLSRRLRRLLAVLLLMAPLLLLLVGLLLLLRVVLLIAALLAATLLLAAAAAAKPASSGCDGLLRSADRLVVHGQPLLCLGRCPLGSLPVHGAREVLLQLRVAHKRHAAQLAALRGRGRERARRHDGSVRRLCCLQGLGALLARPAAAILSQ